MVNGLKCCIWVCRSRVFCGLEKENEGWMLDGGRDGCDGGVEDITHRRGSGDVMIGRKQGNRICKGS